MGCGSGVLLLAVDGDYEARLAARARRSGAPGPAALGRRPAVPLHRGHHRPAEGRRLAGRGLLPAGLGGGAPGHRAARPRARDAGRQARRDPAARLTAGARDRARHGDRDAQRRRHRRAARRPAARRRRAVAARRARAGGGDEHRRRDVRPSAPRRARPSTTCARSTSRRSAPIVSSGMAFIPATKQALLDRLPGLTIVDTLGASEAMITRSTVTRDGASVPTTFAAKENVRVLTDDGRDVVPGSGEDGVLAVAGRLPLGYHHDPGRHRAHVPRGRRRPLRDPGRPRPCARRRQHRAAGPRLRVHQHGRREGVPGRGRAGAARSSRGARRGGGRGPGRAVGRDGDRARRGGAGLHASTTRSASTPATTWPGTRCRSDSSRSRPLAATVAGKPDYRRLRALAVELTHA